MTTFTIRLTTEEAEMIADALRDLQRDLDELDAQDRVVCGDRAEKNPRLAEKLARRIEEATSRTTRNQFWDEASRRWLSVPA